MLKVSGKKRQSQHQTGQNSCSVYSTGFYFASLSLGLTQKVLCQMLFKV